MNGERHRALRSVMQLIGDIVDKAKKAGYEIEEFYIADLYELLHKSEKILDRIIKDNGHKIRIEEVIPLLRAGYDVRRKEMIGSGYICNDIYSNTMLFRDLKNDEFREYVMTSRDLHAEDWEVLKKKVKKYPVLLSTREGRRKTSESKYYDLNDAIQDYKDTPYKVERLITEVSDLIEEVDE